MTLAQAAPAIPNAGIGPRPKISTASSAMFSAFCASAIASGVRMSCRPRSAPKAAMLIKIAGPPSSRIFR